MDRDRRAGRAGESSFPVRIRLGVSTENPGARLETMRAWLDQHLGPSRYDLTPEAASGIIGARFRDRRDAIAFIERFACGVALLPVNAAHGRTGSASRDDAAA